MTSKKGTRGVCRAGGRALSAALKICYGAFMAAFSGIIIAEDHFSKRRDAYRGRYGKQPLRQTEERST